MAAKTAPYISFVVVARNDDYAGQNIRRLQASLDCLIAQLNKYSLESEVVLVEWNQDLKSPPLSESIQWPKDSDYCSVRIITVPHKYHKRFRGHEKKPFCATGSANAGIRRAAGEFVVAKVSDSFYSNELVARIAQKNLRTDEMYRVIRHDVDSSLLNKSFDRPDDCLEFCKDHVVCVNDKVPQGMGELPTLHTDACGDFQLMHRSLWERLRGFWERDIMATFSDSLLSYCLLAAGIREVLWPPPAAVYKITHNNMFAKRMIYSKPFFEKFIEKTPLPAAKKSEMIRQYNDKHYPPCHISGVSVVSYKEFIDLCREILAGQRPYYFNDIHWGLGDAGLREVSVVHSKVMQCI